VGPIGVQAARYSIPRGRTSESEIRTARTRPKESSHSRSFDAHTREAWWSSRFAVQQTLSLTFLARVCASEQMRPNRLQNALAALGDAISKVNAAIEEMRREHDPLDRGAKMQLIRPSSGVESNDMKGSVGMPRSFFVPGPPCPYSSLYENKGC
jgi:hypothetical protein